MAKDAKRTERQDLRIERQGLNCVVNATHAFAHSLLNMRSHGRAK